MSDRPAEEQAVAQPSVGDKVNAIIAAAESAAQEITDKARLEAHNILRMAEQQASERITELTREAAQAKTEADQYARDMTEAAELLRHAAPANRRGVKPPAPCRSGGEGRSSSKQRRRSPTT
jgi:vacuolar-type H+-ATPase subunit H